ncbi:aminotransferase [Halteromyces radiatus]|uniref:aminotransferase n=1 Tax=Halteromyces radiatus TaxID=101107 RepID=UPI00221F79F4|nr:aminotransferase [Halteromyces radiatus]KAI8098484.1 aminotransferase [Halteromyces radiatus]
MEQPFNLLETILFTPKEGFYLLDLHLKRLIQSAKELDFVKPNKQHISNLLLSNIPSNGPQRVRLLYDKQGHTTLEHTPLSWESVNKTVDSLKMLEDTKILNELPTLKVTLDIQPTDTNIHQQFIRNKTTERSIYTAARERVHVGSNDIFDVILWNIDKQITETSIANIAVGTKMKDQHGYAWKTPILDCGLLSGVFRQHLLDQDEMVEGKITIDDLIKAQQNNDIIVCFNSVRKIYRVYLE